MAILTPELRANPLSPAAAMAGQEEGGLDKLARVGATAGMIALGVPPQVAIAVTSSIGNGGGGEAGVPGDLPPAETEGIGEVEEISDAARQRAESRQILSQILGMTLEPPTAAQFRGDRNPFTDFDDFDVFGF